MVKHIKIYTQFQCLWFCSLKHISIYGFIVSVDVNSAVQFRQKDPMHVISMEELGIYFITSHESSILHSLLVLNQQKILTPSTIFCNCRKEEPAMP